MPLTVRTYGDPAATPVVVLHGGPGAPGSIAALARELADTCHVLEPLQRVRADSPLSVAVHVADLVAVVQPFADRGVAPTLVGSSWGAMLALAFAAAHPAVAGPLVLVGCGTFDPVSRAAFQATLARRRSERLGLATAVEVDSAADDDNVTGYSVDLVTDDDGTESYDAEGGRETWDDMLRLQADGTYPASFAAIRSPVLMLHGDYDPHPGRMIRDSLLPHLPQIEYIELKRCGHYPWLERAAREAFYAHLRAWLTNTTKGP